jgi:multidrug efflux pump subunit AcrA (membrane-fusion protein)
MAPEGTLVKEGDMLVQFDPTEMLKLLTDKQNELIIQQSEIRKFKADQDANMARLEADVDNARITFELSKLIAERMKFESESQQKQSELELERNKNSYEGSKQRIESQKIINESDFNKLLIREKQIVGEVEKVQRDIDALTVKAPMQGLVVYEFNWQTDRKFSIGDEPWSGSSLISLPDLSKVQVATMVNEVDVSKVRVGQEVKIKLDAFPDRMFSGKVNSVATIGKNKDNNATVKVFDVLIDVNEVDPVFKPGMTTSNEIVTEIIPDVVSVPLEAIFEKDSKTILYKIAGNSTQLVEITLGKKNSDFVIIEKGLRPGDVVALKNPVQKDNEQNNADLK